MRRVVITGGPGAGKTTLLSALAGLGYPTVSDSAREVIAERLARGQSPRPEPEAFAREILRRDEAKYSALPEGPGLVFFDRSGVEAVAMLAECAAMPEAELLRQSRRFDFCRTVFMLPPWESIYRTDAQRDHTFAHAQRVHGQLSALYRRCGYVLDEVPQAPVGQRVRHVLDALDGGGA
jgi:predicted ATPase